MNTKVHKEIFSTIGITFNLLAHGITPDINTLKKHITTLNILLIQGHIDSNEYDYLVDALETIIQFVTP